MNIDYFLINEIFLEIMLKNHKLKNENMSTKFYQLNQEKFLTFKDELNLEGKLIFC